MLLHRQTGAEGVRVCTCVIKSDYRSLTLSDSPYCTPGVNVRTHITETNQSDNGFIFLLQ